MNSGTEIADKKTSMVATTHGVDLTAATESHVAFIKGLLLGNACANMVCDYVGKTKLNAKEFAYFLEEVIAVAFALSKPNYAMAVLDAHGSNELWGLTFVRFSSALSAGHKKTFEKKIKATSL
jgi:hypothetical protein